MPPHAGQTQYQLLHILFIAKRGQSSPDSAVVEALTAEGHRVERADGVAAASRSLGTKRFDLLVADWSAGPEMLVDVARRMGRDLPTLPIAVLCGLEEECAVAEALLGGHTDCPVMTLPETSSAALPRLLQSLHRRAILEIQTRQLARDLRRRTAELESANTRILEHRQRMLEQERLRAVLELARATRHRLNQPLAVLIGSADLLESKLGETDSPAARCLGRIVESGQEIAAILARVSALLRHQTSGDGGSEYLVSLERDSWHALVATGDAEAAEAMTRALGPLASHFEVTACTAGRAALDLMRGGKVDVALVDSRLEDIGGVEFLREALAARPETAVVVLTHEGEESLMGTLLAEGAVDCLPWSLVSRETVMQSLRHAVRRLAIEKQLVSVEAELRSQAALDPATGLSTRSRLLEVLGDEFERARRHRRALSVVVLDLEEWSALAERLGGEGAEALLAELGRCLAREGRQADSVAQIAPARYAAVLPETERDGAEIFAGRVTESLRRTARAAGEVVQVRAGVAALDGEGSVPDAASLLRVAGAAIGRAETDAPAGSKTG